MSHSPDTWGGGFGSRPYDPLHPSEIPETPEVPGVYGLTSEGGRPPLGHPRRAYKVSFTKPINQELVVEFNLCGLNARKDDDLELVWLLCKEGWQKARLGEFFEQRQALSRFTMGALLVSEPVLTVLRREAAAYLSRGSNRRETDPGRAGQRGASA